MATLPAISAMSNSGCSAPTLSWKIFGLVYILVNTGEQSFRQESDLHGATTRRGLISDHPAFASSKRYLAKPETVSKVIQIVKQQLALSDDNNLTPESKFTDFGADSLDTVEIVMALEEFKITVEEDYSQNITTIQEAADLIDKLIDEKAA